MEESGHHGVIKAEEVERAGGLEGEGFDSWESLGTVEVQGHGVALRRSPPLPGSGLHEYYAEGTLPVTADELADINWDVQYRMQWDPYARDITPVLDEHVHGVPQELLLWTVKFPWPLTDRSYVFRRHRSRTPEGHHVLISKGHSHPSVPATSATVRVEDLRNWMRIWHDKDDVNVCHFRLLYFDDMKGNIPTWLVSWAVSKAVPSFLNSLCDAVQKRKKKGEEEEEKKKEKS